MIPPHISDALATGDLDAVRAFCVRMFDLDPGESLAKCVCHAVGDFKIDRHDTSAWAACFIKSRLYELGAFRLTASGLDPTFRVGCNLHVFFLSLEETGDMLHRLAHDDEKFCIQVARSKLPDTLEFIQPIDRVSHRVTKWKTA